MDPYDPDYVPRVPKLMTNYEIDTEIAALEPIWQSIRAAKTFGTDEAKAVSTRLDDLETELVRRGGPL